MKPVITAITAALAIAALPALANEGHDAFGRPGDPQKVDRTIRIDASDAMRFTPSSITVKRGETVRFMVHNRGMLAHELVLGSMAELKEHAAMMREMPDMKHSDPDEAQVGPGKSAQIVWQFTRAGEEPFACLVPGHMEAGMIGHIRVVAR